MSSGDAFFAHGMAFPRQPLPDNWREVAAAHELARRENEARRLEVLQERSKAQSTGDRPRIPTLTRDGIRQRVFDERSRKRNSHA